MEYKSIFYHCPNGQSSSGINTNIKESFSRDCEETLMRLSKDDVSSDKLSNVCFLTYSNYSYETLIERFYKSIGLSNTCAVLARGVKEWTWLVKLQTVYNFIDAGGADGFEYILATDATDVGVLGNINNLVDCFERIGADLLFCPTCSNWPPISEHKRFEDKHYSGLVDHKHYRLSAGAYMARVKPLREKLAEILSLYESKSKLVLRSPVWISGEGGFIVSTLRGLKRYYNDFSGDRVFDDQQAWRALHVKYYPKIKVDYKSMIFARYDSHLIRE